MNHGIVLLICFLVPEIRIGCGDDSQWLHSIPNLGNYVILRNVVQEDFIDLNSIKPEALMKLESNILNEEKKIRNESVQGHLNPYKNYSQVISRRQEEGNLARPSTRPDNYLAGNQIPRYDSVDDSIHQVKYRQKDKELESINTKYTKKYSEKTKNVHLITKHVEPLQGNDLVEGKEKKQNEPRQSQAEKQIIYKEKKENIVLNKQFLNLPKSPENGNPYFKPKLKEFSENERGKIEENKIPPKKNDYRIHQPTIESSRGQMLKPDKATSMDKDHGPLEAKKVSGAMNQTRTFNTSQINSNSYLDLDHNLLQPGNFLIAKVTSKKGDTPSNDHISLNKSRISFNSTKKPFENISTTTPKAKASSMHNKVQNSTKTLPVDNPLPNHEEKIGGGLLSPDYIKKTMKEGDINDLIQVDVYGAFFNRPSNETVRPRKDIEGPEPAKLITPWKTVDMVLAGFVLLTIFVLGTICLALRVKKKRKKKRLRVHYKYSEENGSSSNSSGDGRPGALRSLSPPKKPSQRVNLARFQPTNQWSESNQTDGRTSDYSDGVTWSEPSNSPTRTVRYHKRSSRKNPKSDKNLETRPVPSMVLPSLPTVPSSSSAPTLNHDVRPSYPFRNIPGYIPSAMLPSLPTVYSESSSMSDS